MDGVRLPLILTLRMMAESTSPRNTSRTGGLLNTKANDLLTFEAA